MRSVCPLVTASQLSEYGCRQLDWDGPIMGTCHKTASDLIAPETSTPQWSRGCDYCQEAKTRATLLEPMVIYINLLAHLVTMEIPLHIYLKHAF